MNRHTTLITGTLVSSLLVLAACSDDTATAPPVSSPPATSPAPTDPPATTPASDPPPPDSAPANDELAAQIETRLADALELGAIDWTADGPAAPPTAIVAAVRVPGRDDIVVGVGTDIDGAPVVADAPFGVSSLSESLVRSVAFQLVDEGTLDPTWTVDRWVATLPNADRVTVQMLLDGTTGWSDYGVIEPDPVTSDLERAWALRDVVESQATAMTALAEPGTRSDDRQTNETVLGLVVEEVAGQPLADLVRERVTEPAGLDATALATGFDSFEGFRHGVFVFEGQVAPTAAFPATAFLTWNAASQSAVSTPTDLLDLLDVWNSGELFTTDRTPAPSRYAVDEGTDADNEFYPGLGVPWNAYCPCTVTADGVEPTAFGRAPGGLATRTYILRYADDISVVVHFNSNSVVDGSTTQQVATDIHALAAAG